MAGCLLKREGASHSIWINPATGVKEAVPRHNEIKEPLARKILASLGASWADDDVLAAARMLARQQRTSLGAVISELAR